MSHSVLLRIGIVSKKIVEKIKTRILCSITFFQKAVPFDIMWKYMAEPGRPEMTI
jgi:hypothetical protein